MVDITESFSQLTPAVGTSKMNKTHIPSIFYDQRIVTHGKTAYVLAENCTEFVSRCFETLCNIPGLNQTKCTEIPPHTYRQAAKYNRSLIEKLYQYCLSSSVTKAIFYAAAYINVQHPISINPC